MQVFGGIPTVVLQAENSAKNEKWAKARQRVLTDTVFCKGCVLIGRNCPVTNEIVSSNLGCDETGHSQIGPQKLFPTSTVSVIVRIYW